MTWGRGFKGEEGEVPPSMLQWRIIRSKCDSQ